MSEELAMYLILMKALKNINENADKKGVHLGAFFVKNKFFRVLILLVVRLPGKLSWQAGMA